MISAPIPNVDRAVWRAVFEAVAQFTPVTAALARVYQTTHPSQFEQALAQWRADVSASINDHTARLTQLEAVYQPRMLLSANAQALGVWLAGQSRAGLEENLPFDAVQAAFPKSSRTELQDAAAELKLYGLAEVMAVMGNPAYQVSPTFDLFCLMDPLVMNTSPQNDAVKVAREALDLGGGQIPRIAARLDWPPRRINPALALLLPLVSIVSQEKQPDYVTRYFAVGADERVRFKRLIAEAEGHHFSGT